MHKIESSNKFALEIEIIQYLELFYMLHDGIRNLNSCKTELDGFISVMGQESHHRLSHKLIFGSVVIDFWTSACFDLAQKCGVKEFTS